ncbi:MAG: hypothetical protein U0263_28960, partial [Polyangiaceae bacterium]
HTYSGLSYVPPPVDALVSMGGSLWKTGSYGRGTWAFSFTKTEWSRKADGPAEQGFGDASAYDPKTGHVFRRANSRVLEYDPVADAFSDRAESNGGFWASNVSAALDPDARLMLIVGGGRVDFYHLDSDQYEQDVAVVGASAKDLFGEDAPGLDFDSSQKKFVLWHGGSEVFTFDPTAKAFAKHAGAGPSPGPVTTSGGVFGRFRYVPSRNVFVRLNSVDENVFAFRLAEGSGVPLPKPDAGAGTGGSGGGAGASGSGGGSGAAGKSASSDDSGCGCRTAPRGPLGGCSVLGALSLLLTLSLGRRRDR